jgi:hypothetical protein
MFRRACFRVLGSAIGFWAALACGGATFDGRVFQSSELAFRVGAVPEGWRRVEADGALVAYRDDRTPATIAVGGRCGKDGDDVPLESLTHHLFFEFTDRTLENQTALQLDGRAALRTDLVAKLDGVEKRFSIFVLKKNGCVYDFLYIAPPDAPSDGQKIFVAFVEGFSTIKP